MTNTYMTYEDMVKLAERDNNQRGPLRSDEALKEAFEEQMISYDGLVQFVSDGAMSSMQAVMTGQAHPMQVMVGMFLAGVKMGVLLRGEQEQRIEGEILGFEVPDAPPAEESQ